jgi:hypothetical protein
MLVGLVLWPHLPGHKIAGYTVTTLQTHEMIVKSPNTCN